ncbi:hypothetical protein [Vibrio viridaestus]|uniref:Uncharacterized protein n=1 Tax=Vibrio viridaestus TaxID=2487322 RepID=A0A3N9TF43_9VIBR|nr:hypothetical protein [Vibrio viridaestus]RQW62660.1 hypothetical protein EES38_13115 [Vibrio viridaestus]
MAPEDEITKLKQLEKELVQVTQEFTIWQVNDYRLADTKSAPDQLHVEKGEQLQQKMDQAQCAYAKQIEYVRSFS